MRSTHCSGWPNKWLLADLEVPRKQRHFLRICEFDWQKIGWVPWLKSSERYLDGGEMVWRWGPWRNRLRRLDEPTD